MKRVLLFGRDGKSHFDAIKSGAKTIETRAGTTAYAKIRPGDTLVLRCGDDRLERVVKDIRRYDSVEDIFNSPDFARIMPGVDSLEEAERSYYSFPGYRQRIAETGILAFELETSG